MFGIDIEIDKILSMLVGFFFHNKKGKKRPKKFQF